MWKIFGYLSTRVGRDSMSLELESLVPLDTGTAMHSPKKTLLLRRFEHCASSKGRQNSRWFLPCFSASDFLASSKALKRKQLQLGSRSSIGMSSQLAKTPFSAAFLGFFPSPRPAIFCTIRHSSAVFFCQVFCQAPTDVTSGHWLFILPAMSDP